MKRGFTLAEVLITLGIIGIVAAMTLPSLINTYKVKALETQFKTVDSILNQAILKTSDEVGMDLKDLRLSGAETDGGRGQAFKDLKEQVPAINDAWVRQFKGATRFTGNEFYYHVIVHGLNCHGMMGETLSGCPVAEGYILPNGAMITKWSANVNGGAPFPAYIAFSFDTNGPFKGPNRWGYDIFTYNSADDGFNSLCNPTLHHSESNKGCYRFAHKNKNPIKDSKPYWDMLYKPLSYWQSEK